MIKNSSGWVSRGDFDAHLRDNWQTVHGVWPGIFSTGVWTPIDSSGQGLSLTSSGMWIKLGRLVWASGVITFPATANATANLIGGLPFTSLNSEDGRGGGMVSYNGMATAATVHVTKNAKTFRFRKLGGTAYTYAELTQYLMYFSVLYLTTEG
jgi:hypothetical protein